MQRSSAPWPGSHRSDTSLGRRGIARLGIVTYQHERTRAIIDEHLPVAQRTLESVTLTVNTGGRLRGVTEHSIVVPSSATARIQEMHSSIIHAVSTLLDARIAARPDGLAG